MTNYVRKKFHLVRITHQAKPEHVQAYLGQYRDLVVRAEHTLTRLHDSRMSPIVMPRKRDMMADYIGHAKRQIDQVDPCLFKGETILHDGKVFVNSGIKLPHTRWISKGKAGVMVELGVPLCIVEDGCCFILYHVRMMGAWTKRRLQK